MRAILVATDGSEGAGRAVDLAAELAKTSGARLCVVTVGENLPLEELHRLARAERDVGAVLETLSEHILKQATARARSIGAPTVDSAACWGDVAETIIEAARSRGVDAIVLGRRGRGQLAGLLLGSVSQKVVSLAPCAVIVAP